MSPIITTVVWSATMLAAQGFGLLGLWLRLRWRAEQKQVHRQYVVAIARTLPEGSQIDEGHPDGTWLRLAIGPARRSAGNDNEGDDG